MFRSHRGIQKLETVLVIFSVFTCLLLMGCVITAPQTAAEQFPFQLMISRQDPPAGYKYLASDIPQVPGADSRVSSFGYAPEPQNVYLGIRHQLAVYPDEQTAIKAFKEWEQENLASDWERPAGSKFSPRDPNDQFRFGCLNRTLNGFPIKICDALQKHKQVISFISTNIDDHAITLAQFEEILNRIDERMQGISCQREIA